MASAAARRAAELGRRFGIDREDWNVSSTRMLDSVLLDKPTGNNDKSIFDDAAGLQKSLETTKSRFTAEAAQLDSTLRALDCGGEPVRLGTSAPGSLSIIGHCNCHIQSI